MPNDAEATNAVFLVNCAPSLTFQFLLDAASGGGFQAVLVLLNQRGELKMREIKSRFLRR
jgi:hypothetical protein